MLSIWQKEGCGEVEGSLLVLHDLDYGGANLALHKCLAFLNNQHGCLSSLKDQHGGLMVHLYISADG